MTGEDVAARVHAYAWTDRKPGLERTRALLAALGNPEKALKFVHITGSNGKGSTAAMLASVLTAAGYRTGLFTSPHLYRFNERFQVNGAPIPGAALDRLAERVLAAADTVSYTHLLPRWALLPSGVASRPMFFTSNFFIKAVPFLR